MEIKLTQGYSAQVDPDDFVRLNDHKWQYNDTKRDGNGYAVRNESTPRGTKRIYMHREIVGAQPNEVVQHLDHDNLNNHRANLKIITHSQRASYTKSAKQGISGFRGVYPSDNDSYWAAITVSGRTKRLGTFHNAEDAAKMYDIAACEYHGQFAVLNFPDDPPTISLKVALDRHRRDVTRRQYEAGERTTPYVGVSRHGGFGYRATFQVDGKQRYLGTHDTMEEAAHAYDDAVLEYYGPEAFVNLI